MDLEHKFLIAFRIQQGQSISKLSLLFVCVVETARSTIFCTLTKFSSKYSFILLDMNVFGCEVWKQIIDFQILTCINTLNRNMSTTWHTLNINPCPESITLFHTWATFMNLIHVDRNLLSISIGATGECQK